MDKQLSEMSTVELKALAYDQIGILERSQQNLKFINAEIEKRGQTEQKANSVTATPMPLNDGFDISKPCDDSLPEPSEE